MLSKTANKLIKRHISGKRNKIANKILSEISKKAIESGLKPPFTISLSKKEAMGIGPKFDFYATEQGKWTGQYGDYTSEIKKTMSGFVTKIMDPTGKNILFMVMPNAEGAFKAANDKLQEIAGTEEKEIA